MHTDNKISKHHRARWAAIGAAVAVSLGAGSIGIVKATAPAGASAFVGTEPCRLLDTRPAPGVHIGPFSTLIPNGKITVEARGDVGECAGPTALPDNATGLQLNVTPIGATQATNLRVYPGDGNPPNASNLNPAPGQRPIPNAVTVQLDDDGKFSIFNQEGNVDVAVDVVGHYTDHHHDDRYYTKGQADSRYYTTGQADSRYYTKSEVDGQLAEDGPTAWGMSRADGSLRLQSPNVVEVLHPGTGLYCVVFDPPISSNLLEGTAISGSGSGPVIGEKTNGIGGPDSCSGAPNGDGLELRIYDASGNLSDERFSFLVP